MREANQLLRVTYRYIGDSYDGPVSTRNVGLDEFFGMEEDGEHEIIRWRWI